MFTGLVEGKGRIISLTRTRAGWRLCVHAGRLARGVKSGDSLAVDGCCLTALGKAVNGILRFDIVRETWRRTTLRHRSPGDAVNLERPLRWGDRLGGHLVQGHVDGVGKVLQGGARLAVLLPSAAARYAVAKGSIALDGVSLTVAAKHGNRIEAALIPKTRRVTTLGARRAGDLVNVEADLLMKGSRPRRRPSPGRPLRRSRRGTPAGAPRASKS